MTPETEFILKRNIQLIEIDISYLENKKRTNPKAEHYGINKLIFLHEKIKRSIEFEILTNSLESNINN